MAASGLLSGIRVIEMSHVMAAPACGLLLADMGADMIKVESLPHGDDIRRYQPIRQGESAAFAMMNRNKRGAALDMKSDGGKAALRRLIEGADVFIENYRRGAVETYGAGYGQVRETCPRPAAGQGGGAGHRHHRGRPCRHGHRRGPAQADGDGSGPVPGHLAVRGRHPASTRGRCSWRPGCAEAEIEELAASGAVLIGDS